MFIVQPESSFGDRICIELDSKIAGRRQWLKFEFAAAWVNRPGAMKIKDSARNFLSEGGCISATVGLDFSSTSYEGLGVLLGLEAGGADITTHVFFDENRSCTFHPKVFLFSNSEQARLFVGSNNLTGAGMTSNVEAALEVTGSLNEEAMVAAHKAMLEWRDVSREPRTARRLTDELLEQLRERGYVRTEEEIRRRRNSDDEYRPSLGEPLFGRSKTTTSGQAGEKSEQESVSSDVSALLMRVRPRRNGKQFQISIKIYEGPFMDSALEVRSVDGIRKEIGYNYARGKRNTARFEAPEMNDMQNPVARFRWVSVAGNQILQYEVFDAALGGEGAEIFQKLEDGISTPPATNLNLLGREETVLSKSNQEIAQWYRLD